MYAATKRFLDVLFSALGLTLLGPLLAAIALRIRADASGPVLYRSLRVGRGGKPFWMLKFRTMVEGADRNGSFFTCDDDPRITAVGRFLRRYKLDELPQLFNVLRGDMSLVGPRPQVPALVARYSDTERTTLSVLPGITDLGSLAFLREGAMLTGSPDPGREYLERLHPEKLRLSLEYLQRRSLWLDLRLIWRTLTALAGLLSGAGLPVAARTSANR